MARPNRARPSRHGILIAQRDSHRLTLSLLLCVIVYWLSKPHNLDGGVKHGIVSRTSHAGLGFYLKGGVADEFAPHLIWLMGYPQSGEGYIMTNAEHVSNLSPASNYGHQVTTREQANSISVYPRHPEGPFWEGLGVGKRRKLPDKFVLTKTHCGGYCLDCPPENYIVDIHNFMDECRTTVAKVDKTSQRIDKYSRQRVKKAVHVIRNPFINLIARFIREREHDRRKDREFQEEYPMLPKKGFQKWCQMLDNKYQDQDKEAFEKHKETFMLLRSSLCHAEVFKYIQWHNLAFETTSSLKLPTIVVYYEDFYDQFKQTQAKILEFAELPWKEKPYAFPVPHNYSRYFSPEHREGIGAFAKRIASSKTWDHVQHYFFKNATI